MSSVIVSSENVIVKIPLNQPAIDLEKSQSEQFRNLEDGPRVKHIYVSIEGD